MNIYGFALPLNRTKRPQLAGLLALAGLLSCAGLAHAEIRLPAILAEHMVLQQKQPLPIWGWAEPGEQITVSFAGQTKTSRADNGGRWQVTLDPLPANAEPRDLTITGSTANQPTTISDVLIGEVWICSGQSNMQWPVSAAINADEEIAQAEFPEIRLFTVPNVTSPVPLDNCGGSWKACSPATVSGFSAVGYFFGRHLHQQLKVPVGLINTSWGGTIAEAWTSGPALRQKLPEFTDALDRLMSANESIEEAKTRYEKAMESFRESLEKLYAIEDDLEAAGKWAAVDFDDSGWKTMTIPANWETTADFKDVDGMVWFRKTITLPEGWAGKDLVLRPGPIDEVDVTWFNGEPVGSRGNLRQGIVRFWNVPREYVVPGKLVKAGKNVIAIRVLDANGQGGLWGAPAQSMVMEVVGGKEALADELEADLPFELPLAGAWRCHAEYVLPPRPSSPNQPNLPSVLFNAMIHPLIPFGIQGAIWYQGESNAGRADQYRTLLPALIGDWRARWSRDFSFLVVQLANFMARTDQPSESGWAELREAQALTAINHPKVGLALAIDIGDAKDIHPRNKQEVGRRLGLAAQAIAYGQDIPYSGPVFKAMQVEGARAMLSFDHANGGLVAKDGKLTGFAVAGADGKFVWAEATIEGQLVVVRAESVPEPVAVRYDWANNPAGNLYNGAGLPAVPFRTDTL